MEQCSIWKEFGVTVTSDPATDQHRHQRRREREGNDDNDTPKQCHPIIDPAKKKVVTKKNPEQMEEDEDADGTGTSRLVGTASASASTIPTTTTLTGARTTHTGWKIVGKGDTTATMTEEEEEGEEEEDDNEEYIITI